MLNERPTGHMSPNHDSTQNAVLDAVRKWQTRLLDLNRRNTLLYFSVGKRGVPITEITPDVLMERLANSSNGLSFDHAERARQEPASLFTVPAPNRDPADAAVSDANEPNDDLDPRIRLKPGDLSSNLGPLELQKRLGNLQKRHREWLEEQGLNVLFIAFGFLRWIDEEQKPGVAPLLLVPCELVRTSPRDPFIVRVDDADDIAVNATLHHKLKQTAGIVLPEYGDSTIAAYLDKVSKLVAKRDDWAVEATVTMAAFPFSKLAMWDDLNRMVTSGVKHPLVRRMAGDLGATIPEPNREISPLPRSDDELAGAKLDDLLDVRDQFAVLDADFSQLRAIQLARSGTNLVIHGPPGTGKSQTIANIIATLLADGRRVLFVSEKTAALDVVKRRLTEVGLGEFCLDLHSERGRKSSVYAQLRESMHPGAASIRPFAYHELTRTRNELNAVVRALHVLRQPLGQSVFDVHGQIASIGDVPLLVLDLTDIADLDEDRLADIREAAQAVARRANEFQAHHDSRWHCLRPGIRSPRLADIVRNDMARVDSLALAIMETVGSIAEACGIEKPSNLESVDYLTRLVLRFEGRPAAIPRHWLFHAGIARAREAAAELGKTAAERRTILLQAEGVFTGALPGARSTTMMAEIGAVIGNTAVWERVAGINWPAEILVEPESTEQHWRAVAAAAAECQAATHTLNTCLCVAPKALYLESTKNVMSLAMRLAEIGTIPEAWRDIQALQSGASQTDTAKSVAEQLLAAERVLFARFDEEILEDVNDPLRVRYKTDYRSSWRWFNSEYRRDRRMLRGRLRVPASLSVAEALEAIEQALAVKRLRARWAEVSPAIEAALGHYYAGLDTDWDRAAAKLASTLAVFREHPSLQQRFHQILVDAEALESMVALRSAAAHRLELLELLLVQAPVLAESTFSAIAADASGYANAVARTARVVREMEMLPKGLADIHRVSRTLKACASLHELESSAALETQSWMAALGPFFRAWTTEFDALDTALEWTRELVACVPAPMSDDMIDVVTAAPDPEVWRALRTRLKESVTAFAAVRQDLNNRYQERGMPWASWDSAEFEAVRVWCTDISAHADSAHDWLDYCAAIETLDRVLGAGATEALRLVTERAGEVPGIVMRHVYLTWIEHIYANDASLRVAPRDLEAVAEEFRKLDRQLPEIARERVRASCRGSITGINGAGNYGEVGTLTHQLSLRRRQMPVRRLVLNIPNLL